MGAVEGIPPRSPGLVLRGRVVGAGRPAIMAIVNRTDDSFFPGARQADDGVALEAVARAAEAGADIVDVGGVRAGTGPEVDVVEEIRRVVPFVARVRELFPDLLVSVDTWRAEVAREAALAGADLINDTWAGYDPRVVEVVAEHGLGIVCSHTGGATPRTDPYRVRYPVDNGAGADGGPAVPVLDPRDGVLQDVVRTVGAGARRAVAAGVPAASVLVDPTHDFGKNTWHSLHLLRRTPVLAGLGHPLLMALSRKDFIGETLDAAVEDRLVGTLAATAVAAWLGAAVFRAHDVLETRQTLELVAAVRDELPPARVLRGLT